MGLLLSRRINLPNIPTLIISHQFWTSPDKLRRNAQDKLGIDTVNNYNFAVCGRTGTGKSSLINAIRSMADNTNISAKVGEEETTQVITAYPIPGQPHIIIWDCPGGGTDQHPTRNYFERNCLYAFDCLIVLISDRLCELELTIAKKAVKHKVPIVFVRTKADKDVESKVHRGTSVFDAKVELRANTEEKFLPDLSKVGQEFPRLFLVSSWAFTDAKLIQHDEQKLLRFVLREAMERRSTYTFSVVNKSIRLRNFGKFNVGFTGADLVGKSSLIRSIMSLAPNDNEGPPVAEFGTDLPWQTYQNPIDSAMTLHEIPYEDRQIGDITRLQLVCVVIADQIVSTDIMMIKFLHQSEIPFMLIRTKADQLIDRITHTQPKLSLADAKITARMELMEMLYNCDLGRFSTLDNPVLMLSAKSFAEGDYEFMDESKLYPKIRSFISSVDIHQS